MPDTVLAPPRQVILPGRDRPLPLDLAAFAAPPVRLPVTLRSFQDVTAIPLERHRLLFEQPLVSVPGRETPMPMAAPAPTPPPPPVLYATSFATSVALVPAGGTNVTSTPANLMIGPIAYIEDFTINTLDAGTY